MKNIMLSHSSAQALRKQALIFSNYIIRGSFSPKVAERYRQAIVATPTTINSRDQKILHFAMKHPRLIGLLDAGLALTSPHAELRRRLYIVFAVLETMPEHSKHFLFREHSILYVFVICFVGLRTAFRTIFGALLVKVVQL